MVMKTIVTEEVVQKEHKVRVSDFSGVPIPNYHWATVTNIWCMTSDHGSKHGNQHTVFDFDLTVEEMREFQQDLGNLILKHKEKHKK